MAYVVVKYGANEEHLVNPNCLCSVLLSHIKKTCGFHDLSENVDLASETGEVVDLVSKPREYAKRFLEPRANYIVVKVVGEETEESSPTYVSLLDQVGDRIKFAGDPKPHPTPTLQSQSRYPRPPRFLGSDESKEFTTKDASVRKNGTLSTKLAGKNNQQAGGSGAPSMDDLHKETEKKRGKPAAEKSLGKEVKEKVGKKGGKK
ncbi:hypothetical protein BC829DRAFT_382030 [Chytridium lagenaria]|nr:hypothetical protein BC829DRAFT_382030 [Chytridium lagenaria]